MMDCGAGGWEGSAAESQVIVSSTVESTPRVDNSASCVTVVLKSVFRVSMTAIIADGDKPAFVSVTMSALVSVSASS